METKVLTGNKITTEMVLIDGFIDGLLDGSIVCVVPDNGQIGAGRHISKNGTICEGEWVDDELLLDWTWGLIPIELCDKESLLDTDLDPNAQPLCRAYERWIAKNPDTPFSKFESQMQPPQ